MTSPGRSPWWRRMDEWVGFQPARWPHAEVISRIAALAIIAAFLAVRLWQFDRFPQTWSGAYRFYSALMTSAGVPVYSLTEIALLWGLRVTVWLIETGIFIGYIAAYISRVPAKAPARGIMETIFPIVVAGLPVLMAMTPYTLPRWAPPASTGHIGFYLGAMFLMALGGLINLIGLLSLRRAFTIMTEARLLITGGIFRYIRHPLYTGHFIMFLGTLLLRWQWVTLLLYLLFSLGQVKRARLEERKLLDAFPEYGGYQHRTGMFWPRWTRRDPECDKGIG
jgi:protein-S-isoprenylcysteine O-methyltransferase Ste14